MADLEAGPLVTRIHDLLYCLGVKATTQGFMETSCAIFLVMQDSESQWFSIMEIYQQISVLDHIDFGEIDPRIRFVIHRIWKRNPQLLSRLAGRRLEECPTPRKFLEIMRRALTANALSKSYFRYLY